MYAHMKVNVYVNFDGNTEEAFTFYRSVFGGEFLSLNRFKDMPPSEQQVQETEKDRIMHIALQIGENTVLMGSDIPENMGKKLMIGNNIHVSLHPQSMEETKRLFKELSAGGTIEMPLEKMFWGDYYASFTDKFGIQWMLNYHEEE